MCTDVRAPMSAKVAMHMNTSRNNSDKGADVSKGGITHEH